MIRKFDDGTEALRALATARAAIVHSGRNTVLLTRDVHIRSAVMQQLGTGAFRSGHVRREEVAGAGLTGIVMRIHTFRDLTAEEIDALDKL